MTLRFRVLGLTGCKDVQGGFSRQTCGPQTGPQLSHNGPPYTIFLDVINPKMATMLGKPSTYRGKMPGRPSLASAAAQNPVRCPRGGRIVRVSPQLLMDHDTLKQKTRDSLRSGLSWVPILPAPILHSSCLPISLSIRLKELGFRAGVEAFSNCCLGYRGLGLKSFLDTLLQCLNTATQKSRLIAIRAAE